MDPRVADYRNIPDPELLERGGIFIAEGRLVVRRLLAADRFITRSVMVTRAALETVQSETAVHPDLPIYVVPQQVMNTIAGFNIHRGCLAVGERRPPSSWRELAARAHRLVILERVGDADNVGSIFRSAAAFGMNAVLLDSACADPLYRKAIRTSMGASLLLPFARIAAQPDSPMPADAVADLRATSGSRTETLNSSAEWPHALSELRRQEMITIALTPSPAAPLFRTLAERLAGRRVALVVGHEGEGLSREALDACEMHARIPMAAGVDSLNVGVAAAIAMYELSTARG